MLLLRCLGILTLHLFMRSSGCVIWVTGASGQLGRELQRLAASDNIDTSIIGQKKRGEERKYIFTDSLQLDITDRAAVLDFVECNGVNIIVNCAAYTNVDGAEDDAGRANLVNNVAVGYLAAAAKSVDALVIHISTDYVFDGCGERPCLESDLANPIGVYGATKLAGERCLEGSGCRYIIIRTSWLYSAWGSNFVKSMQRLTSERSEVAVVADQFGSPTFAGDLADVIGVIIDKNIDKNNKKNIDKEDNDIKNIENNMYHYSNCGECSWFDFATVVCELLGNSERCRVLPIASEDFPSRVARPKYSVLDKSKIIDAFGVEIPSWRDSLERCIEQLKI